MISKKRKNNGWPQILNYLDLRDKLCILKNYSISDTGY